MRNQVLGLFSLILAIVSGSVARGAEQDQCAITLAQAQSHDSDPAFATAPLRVFKASTSVSQWVRDNAPDFWRFMRDEGASYFPHDVTSHEGWIVGDFHAGNYIYAPVDGVMTLFIADIKDAGRGPLIYDFERLIMSTIAVNGDRVSKQETTRRIFHAYKMGLTGKQMRMPYSVRAALDVSVDEYIHEQKNYVERQIHGSKFKEKPGQVEEIPWADRHVKRFKDFQADVERAVHKSYPGANILDYAYRPRERGGSKDQTRYWALIRFEGEKQIIEFKEIGEPAVSWLGPQAPMGPRYAGVKKAYWPRQDNTYQAVIIEGKAFLLRPKKIDMFAVPYKQQSKQERDLLLDIAEWEAYDYGKNHAKQDSDGSYKLSVIANADRIELNLRQLAKDYLKALENKIHDSGGAQ